MYCSSPTRRRSAVAVLCLTILASTPMPTASAQQVKELPSLEAAAQTVAAAEQHLADVTALEVAAKQRLDGLTHRNASIVNQLAEARSEVRRWTVDSYVSDRSSVAAMLSGSDSAFETSARNAYLSSMTKQWDDAAERYEHLRAQVEPTLVELAENISEVETARLAANDAVLAARANEAEVERLHAEAAEAAAVEAATRAAAAKAERSTAATAAAGAPTAASVEFVDTEQLQGPAAPAGGPTEEQWARLRQCEATGNYQAVSKSGKYRGAYQFDMQTWATMGPAGDPAAASPAEQDRRAKLLYASRGWRPWPHCGKHLR